MSLSFAQTRTRALSMISLTALAVMMATSASAQSAAQDKKPAPAAPSAVEEVVVTGTGFRESYATAVETKRNSI